MEDIQTELIVGLDTYSPYLVTKICTIDMLKMDSNGPFFDIWGQQKLHPREYFGCLYLTSHSEWCWDVALPLDHNNQDYGLADGAKKRKFNIGRREKDIEKWLTKIRACGVVVHEFNWKPACNIELPEKVTSLRPLSKRKSSGP